MLRPFLFNDVLGESCTNERARPSLHPEGRPSSSKRKRTPLGSVVDRAFDLALMNPLSFDQEVVTREPPP
ncbi:MAG: hypothetical protein CMN91_00115 [Synechococcus sp. ARS1019]|nr:hypothetical protein [Synechococcus sp. ARS1019]